MNDFINTADIIGDDEMCDRLIMRTLTEYRENRVTKLRARIFRQAETLKLVDVPNVTRIENAVFYLCLALDTLILRNSKICVLTSAELNDTPIAKGTGYIYVPRAFLSDTDATKDYRRATNWSTYAAQFRALEDYTVDGTVTGELDETKI